MPTRFFFSAPTAHHGFTANDDGERRRHTGGSPNPRHAMEKRTPQPSKLGLLLASSALSGPPAQETYRAERIVCATCGWITTVCQRASIGAVKCSRCGRKQDPPATRPSLSMIRRWFFGGRNGR